MIAAGALASGTEGAADGCVLRGGECVNAGTLKTGEESSVGAAVFAAGTGTVLGIGGSYATEEEAGSLSDTGAVTRTGSSATVAGTRTGFEGTAGAGAGSVPVTAWMRSASQLLCDSRSMKKK
jgi:hypothetical protein